MLLLQNLESYSNLKSAGNFWRTLYAGHWAYIEIRERKLNGAPEEISVVCVYRLFCRAVKLMFASGIASGILMLLAVFVIEQSIKRRTKVSKVSEYVYCSYTAE